MIKVVGVGPGSSQYLTPIAQEEVKKADILVGSSRALALFNYLGKERRVVKSNLEEILTFLRDNHRKRKIAVLVSGDPLFYSFLDKLLDYFGEGEIEVFPGISSLQMSLAKVKRTLKEVVVLSLHGRNRKNLASLKKFLLKNRRVLILTDNQNSPALIASELRQEGLRGYRAVVCENLSYPEEKIIDTDLETLSGMSSFKTSLLYLEPLQPPASSLQPPAEGKFYGVGVGPGDPELLTIKAKRVLEKVDIIFVPKSEEKKQSLSLEVVQQGLNDSEKSLNFCELVFPMTRNRKTLEEFWEKAAKGINAELVKGRNVAFITMGDPLLYSTYIYVLEWLKRKNASLSITTIPGISSPSASAAATDISLAEGGEKLAIVPANRGLQELPEILEKFETVVLLKVSSNLGKILDLLKELDLIKKSVFVSKVGLEGEYIERDLPGKNWEELKSLRKGYLSTIIVKKGGKNRSE